MYREKHRGQVHMDQRTAIGGPNVVEYIDFDGSEQAEQRDRLNRDCDKYRLV